MRKRASLSFLIALSIIVCSCISVLMYAKHLGLYADVVTIPNDGQAVDIPYGDTKLPNSYEGADYYDCLIPYNLTVADVGGWANNYHDAKSAYAYSMSDYPRRKDYKIGCGTMTREGLKSVGSTWHGMSVSKDSLGMNVFTDRGGNKYYACALPYFMYNFGGLGLSNAGDFPGWSLDSDAQAFDMILTDGTCIHFVVCDRKANAHTNWGENGRSPRNPDVQYTYAPINYQQYANIFQAANGETFELWGDSSCVSNFMSTYNISSTGNKVAVVRMYNIVIDKTTPTRACGADVSYKLADSVSITNSEGTRNGGTNALTVAGSTLVEEWELVGMPDLIDMAKYQSSVELPTRDNLGVNDLNALVAVGDYMELVRSADLFDRIRVGIVFVGILVLLYGVFLLVAMLFDKVNNFIDISMVSLLTGGKIYYDPWGDSVNTNSSYKFASTKKLLVVSLIVIAVGMFLLSSGMSKILGRILYAAISGTFGV